LPALAREHVAQMASLIFKVGADHYSNIQLSIFFSFLHVAQVRYYRGVM
jgi:hypothetical protein